MRAVCCGFDTLLVAKKHTGRRLHHACALLNHSKCRAGVGLRDK